MIDKLPEISLPRQVTAGGDPIPRRVQVVEVMVFLWLIVPSLSTSFLISPHSDLGFITGAVLSILSDLGLVALVFYFIWRNAEPLGRIGWSRQTLLRNAGWGLILFLPIAYGANRLENALAAAGLSAPSKLPSFLVATGNSGLALAILLVIVVAVVEETIFRGYLILRLKAATGHPWAAILLSAAVFSLGHGYEGMAGVISVFGLGVVLALVYVWRRSLVAPMIIHFLIDFNSIVLVALLKPAS